MILLTDDEARGRGGHRGCGVGEGADCCAFLVADGRGFGCARGSEVHTEILRRVEAGRFTARRLPVRGFPACQAEGR